MAAPAPISKHYSKTVKSQQLNKAWQQFELMRREVKHPWFLVSSHTKLSQGRFTDTVLVADGKRFPAHKLVLCSCSPYFDRMFQVFLDMVKISVMFITLCLGWIFGTRQWNGCPQGLWRGYPGITAWLHVYINPHYHRGQCAGYTHRWIISKKKHLQFPSCQ